MLPESGERGLGSLGALEIECARLWERACEAARRTEDADYGVKLLTHSLRFGARMLVLRLAIRTGLIDGEGRVLDPLREMRQLLDGERSRS